MTFEIVLRRFFENLINIHINNGYDYNDAFNMSLEKLKLSKINVDSLVQH